MEVGTLYKDFQITKYLDLPELQSTLVQAVHIPSGACVIHIGNQDPENLFCLSFQTLPDSSNGVAHILEHTVLCGSKKFPVKDPFFAMTRRSLNTYMNALTGQDFTCYPASSQVEKDFYNLLSVYLDAVFFPELKKVSFLQEGHRLVLGDTGLQIHGIVYNEMKGAMNGIDARLWEALGKELTPDLPYAHNSGGNPREIPSLTYEELLSFHRNFYHPSRCLFFFYGNLPLAQHLDFIAEGALQEVGKLPPLAPLPLQKRFEIPVITSASYPIAPDEPREKKTEIAFAWLTTPLFEQEKVLALSLLDLMLLETDASPLKLALLKSGLCTEVEAMMDLEMSEIPWVIVCKGTEPEHREPLKKVLFDTLQTLCNTPFSTELIEASLHQLEFDRTEIAAEGVPFGLTLFFRAALIHQHGNEPENALLIHTLFAQLRARIADPHYLPHLLKKFTLDNPHFVQLTLLPDPHLIQKEEEEEKKRLAALLPTLDLESLRLQKKELETYHETIEKQSLACLPCLHLRDVPPHARDFPLTESPEIFHHDCFTNQILYADLLFDLPAIKQEDLPLVALFSRLLGEIGCGGRDYAETLAYQQAYTGGIEAMLSLHVTQEDPQICRPAFSIRGKALYRNTEKLLALFRDLVLSADFSDRERIRELLAQQATLLRSRFSKNALNYATQLAFSGLCLPSYIHNQWNGLPYYESALQWDKTGGTSLLKNLQKLPQLLFSAKPHLILSCDQEKRNQIAPFIFPSQPHSPWKGNYPVSPAPSQIRLISSPVAHSIYALHTASYRDADAPLLHLAAELLENCVLHKEIREKGGAYGAGASYSPTSGNFHLYSYRDPHLASTQACFQHALATIGCGQFTSHQLDEAKFGVLQTLDAPIPPANRAMVAYAWHRAHRPYPLREAFRRQILEASKEAITQAVQRRLLPQNGIFVSFLGKELYEKEKSQLTTPLPVFPTPY